MKKLSVLLMLFMFLFLSQAFAATKVGGKIKKDTVWKLEKSPYLVTKTIIVKPGAKLTIEPGVVVNFSTKAKELLKLEVEGTLVAVGTEDKKITFTSSEEIAAAKQWGGIRFDNSRHSKVEYCIIEGATNGVGCFSSSPKLSNNRIIFNEIGIVCEDYSSPEITFNEIQDNGLLATTCPAGIACSIYSSPKISNNTIQKNIGHGIAVSTFSSPAIENNKIFYNSGRGVLVVSMSDPLIANNNIAFNGTHCGITIYQSSPVVMGNMVHDNYGIGISISLGGNPIIINNTVKENGAGIVVVDASPKIFFNTLVQNKEGIFVSFVSSPVINYNIFENNREYAIKLEDVIGDIDAKNNWWGKTDADDIAKSIYNSKQTKINIESARKEKITVNEYSQINKIMLSDKRETKVDSAYPWHMNGDKILFTSYRDGNWEVYLTNHEGAILRNLTNHASSDEWPSWSPNGKKIMFTSKREGAQSTQIYVIDMENVKLPVTQLTADFASKEYPSWSPDGEKVAFRDEFDNLFFLESNNQKKIPVSSDGITNKIFTGCQSVLYIWPPTE